MIHPNEISDIEEIGQIQSAPIQLIKTIGGLFIATAQMPGRNEPEVLAQGSHKGIVKYSLEKKFQNQATFQLIKSNEVAPPIRDYTEKLPEILAKKGFGLITARNDSGIVAVLNKDGEDVTKFIALKKNEDFYLQEPIFAKHQEAKMAQAMGVTRPVVEAILSDVLKMDGKSLTIKLGDLDKEISVKSKSTL